MTERRLLGSERARLDPFIVSFDDAAPRDQRDLMERPFFSLAKGRRTQPILYKARDVEVQVFAVPEHGMATIWDADVLIWAASQLVEATDQGLRTSRFFRFTPYQLLRGIRRPTGNHQYALLKRALQRLQSTVILTTIRHGENWRRQQFSWINEWEELIDRTGRCHGMEFVLPEWFYRGVIDRSLVLTIDPAYFRLTGGIERWLYRIARKHAGRQRDGWSFELRHLHVKSGSLARFSDFAVDLRRIVRRQSLPGYVLTFAWQAGRDLLEITPRATAELLTGACGKPVNDIGRSGASPIGTSGARLSAHRAHGDQLSLWRNDRNATLNLDSNTESNSSFVGGRDSRRRDRGGAS
jgi:plasmid replication initiation protein